MDPEIKRKLIHSFGFIALAYYFVPAEWQTEIALITVAGVLIFEGVRIKFQLNIKMFREYEKHTLSGFGWCSLGLLFSFLLFPMWITVPVVIAWAWMDPFMGYYRKKDWMIPVTLVLYSTIFAFFAYVLYIYGYGPFSVETLFVAFVVAGAGVWSEMLGKRDGLRWLNDDFTMTLFPSFTYFILAYLAGMDPGFLAGAHALTGALWL